MFEKYWKEQIQDLQIKRIIKLILAWVKIMAVTFEQASEIIEKKGSGIYHIKDGFYAFGEPWDTICVEKKCGHVKESVEFNECAIDYASHITYNKIPEELKKKGYNVIDIRHFEYSDDNVPFGWSVELLKKEMED